MKRTLLLSLLLGLLSFPVQAQQIQINEIDSDTPGTDADEFVELYDGGGGNTPLDGYVLVVFNGSDDESLDAFDLDGHSTDGSGYFLIGNSGVTPSPAITFSGGTLQNGPDAVALYQADASDFPEDTPVTTTDLVDAIVYDTDDSDDAELSVLLNSGEPQVNEDSNNDKDTESIQRIPNGAGGLRNTSSSLTAIPTPGAPNVRIYNADQGETYATIQSAMDDASAGETIQLSDGTYLSGEGALSVDETVTLQGDSRSGVILRPSSSPVCRGVELAADGATLDNVTVDGSSVAQDGSCGNNVAVVQVLADNVTIANTTVNGPGAGEAVGINLFDTDGATIENTLVSNTGKDGINVRSRNVTIRNVTLDGNAVGRTGFGGMGIYASTASTPDDPSASVTLEGTIDVSDNPNGIITSSDGGASSLVTLTNNGATFDFSGTSFWPFAVFGGAADVNGGAAGAFAQSIGVPIQATFTSVAGLELYHSDVLPAVTLVSESGAAGANPSEGVVQDLSTGEFFVGQTAPSKSMSIQTAVDAVGGGSKTGSMATTKIVAAGPTVTVLSGTYEEQVEISTGVTLQGSSGGGTSLAVAKSTPASCTAGTILDASGGSIGVNVTADNVTLSNLCVRDAQNHNVYTDATISNLTLNGVEALNAGNQGVEVHNDARVTTLNILNSTFSGNDKGMRIRGSVDGLTVSSSSFDGNNFGFETTHGNVPGENKPVTNVDVTNTTFNSNPEKGLYVEKLDNALLDGITVQNSGTDVSFGFSPQAVDINLKYGDYGSIEVRNADISGSIGEGLNVKARNDNSGPSGARYDSFPASLVSLTVQGGTFQDNRWGVVVGNNVQGVTITENLVQNNGTDPGSYQNIGAPDNRGGILFYGAPTSASYSVTDNCIIGNQTYGLAGASSNGTVVANGNWWGSSSGPSGDFTGSGDPAFGDVTVNHSTTPVGACPSGTTPDCEATTLSESVQPPSGGNPGVVTATFSNSDGIEKIAFVDPSGNDALDNFTASNPSGDFTTSDGGITWTPTTSSPPTTAVFELTQVTQGEESSYFAEASSVCSDPDPLVVDFDPIHTFDRSADRPDVLTFEGNYPNPFAERTTIEFALPSQTEVTLSVYDLMGRRVATLAQGAMQAGVHQVRWSGRNDGGRRLASGLYLLRLQAGDQTRTGRLTLVR